MSVTVVVAERPMVQDWDRENPHALAMPRPARKGDVVEVPCPDEHNDDPAEGCTGECSPHTGAFKHGDRLMRLTEEPETVLTGYSHETLEGKRYRLTGVWEDR